MPRRRKPGGYSNRTDQTATQQTNRRVQPVRVASGGPYGSRQAREDSQAAVPLPDNQAPPTAAAPSPVDALSAFDLGAPIGMDTEGDPSIPVTAGVPRGPGTNATPQLNVPKFNPDNLLWAKWMPMLELLATRSDSSTELRQFVRRVRGNLPPDQYRNGAG